MIRSKHTVSRDVWGDVCEAWDLLASPGLSVKHERMPARTAEIRHHHQQAEQFFFVLSGALWIELDGVTHVLNAQEGLSVEPGKRHQAINGSENAVEFLVISSPPTVDDRIEES